MGEAIGRKKEIAAFLLLTLIWGSTWSAIRITVTHMPSLRSVALRFLLASAVLVPVLLLRGERWPRGREWLLLLVLAALLSALPFSVVAWSQRHIGPGVTSILFASSPLITLWMETWLGGPHRLRRVPRRALLGTVVGLAGVSLVLVHAASTLGNKRTVVVMLLLLTAFGSAGMIKAKQWLAGIPIVTIAAVENLFSCLMVGALSLALEPHRPTQWTPASVGALLFLGLFSSALGFLLFYWLLMRIEPYQLSARYLLMPVFAVAEGTVWFHEAVSPLEIAGGVAVVVALGLVLSVDRGEGQPAGGEG